MSAAGRMFRELAIETFHPQYVVDIDNTEAFIKVCEGLTEKAGYPYDPSREDDWMEYVYTATDMWEIANKGFTYKRERNPDKPSGWDYVLYTRANHPGFRDY